MKKAVLSNRIYLSYNLELYKDLKEKLTFKLPSKDFKKPYYTKTLIKTISKSNVISIPSGCEYMIPKDYEIVDKRTSTELDFPEFKFKLRPEQAEVVDNVTGSCLINANTAWGKTFSGIAIAAKFGLKTLVIVDRITLRDQWCAEVEKTLGIKPGIIGGVKGKQTMDYIDKPITIANIQTLRKHANTLRNTFGMIILDEVHHCPATMFETTLNTINAKIKIGLSATLERKDKLHVVIPYYFGPKIFKPKRSNQLVPEVIIVETDIKLSSNNMIPWATRVNTLYAKEDYKELIVSITKAMSSKGHKVLVVSDRIFFLEDCKERLGDSSVIVTGSTPDRDKIFKDMGNGMYDQLLGILSIFKEGISLDWLSCIILATPVNNDPLLEQLIGRILRIYPNKLKPVLIDIKLAGGTGSKQAKNRALFYIKNNYKVTVVNND